MPGDARWIAGMSASALHAAECCLAGTPPADARLHAAIAAEAAALAAELAPIVGEPRRFFSHAIPLAVKFDVPRQLAEVVLGKLLGPANIEAAGGLSQRLTTLFAAFCQALPDGIEQLELRSGPLRAQWEARGPGLLATLGRLTEADVVVESADVILVQPILGGAGRAHPLYNSLHFEAMLANPVPELPEIVRLGWLWGQLNLDLPKYEEQVGRQRREEIGPLALVPPILAAAEEVELASCNRETLVSAVEAWRIPAVDADLLLDWWATYQGSNSAWNVALAALDKLLAADQRL